MSVSQSQLLKVFKELERRIAAIDVRQGGPQGLQGPVGPKGRKGEKGAAGPQGERGAVGPKGPQGDRGLTGPAGKDGKAGQNGAQGPQGPAGRDGKDGLNGAHGRDGKDGVSITDVQIDFDGRLTVQMSDGTEIDAGMIDNQVGDTIVYKGGSGSSSSGGGGDVPPHNALNGLQGGTPGQYYHLTASEHATLIDWANNGLPEFSGAGTSGIVVDPVVENNFFLRDDGTFAPPPVSPIGAIFLNMRWNSGTVADDPGSGEIKANNVDQTLATELYVSDTTQPGNNADFIYQNVNPGEFIGLWAPTSNEQVYYVVTGPLVDNGTWWTIPVSRVSGNGGFANNNQIQEFFLGDPNEKVPNGGDTTQVLTKLSDDDFNDGWEYRSKYIPNYVDGDTYYPQNWVNNQFFIAVANTTTTEPAFPVPVGSPTNVYPDTPPFLDDNHIGQVRSGYYVTFTESGEITTVQTWIPEVSPDIYYTVAAVRDPDGTPITQRFILSSDSLTANAWNDVVLGDLFVSPGVKYLIYLEAHNYATATQITGSWRFSGQSNIQAPPTEEWNHNVANTILRINKNAIGGADRTADLLSIAIGSTIVFDEAPASQGYTTLADPTDEGTYVQYSVALVSSVGTLTVGQPATMTADVPVAQQTAFSYETDKFLVQPYLATFTSFLEYDGVPQAVSPSIGYGINFDFQQLSQSADWDLIKVGGSGGGVGGGFWNSNGSDIYNNNSGNVGIGTTTPNNKLHVQSDAGSNLGVVFTADDDKFSQIFFGSASEPITKGRIRYDTLTDYMHFQTAGTEKMRIDAAGNVGIGTTDPVNVKLDVRGVISGSLAAVNQAAMFGNDTDAVFQGTVFDSFTMAPVQINGSQTVFQTGTGALNIEERMRIDGVGNVGIGTTGPIRRLSVTGNGTNQDVAYLDGAGAASTGLTFSNGLTTAERGRIRYDNADAMQFHTASIERMRIDIAGNVGIGTGSTEAVADQTTLAVNGTNASRLSLYSGGVKRADLASSLFSTALQTTEAVRLVFGTNSVERIRIEADGKVGIGKTSPATPLEVDGEVRSTRVGVANQYVALRSDTTHNAIIANDGANTKPFKIENTSTVHPIQFFTNSAERMRINSAGNVGIGTTNPTNALTVSKTGGTVDMAMNATTTGSSEFIQRGGDSVARHVLVAGGQSAYVDSFEILQNVGGSAQLLLRGNADMSFNTNNAERMRITSAGVVRGLFTGVGVTQNQSKFEVVSALPGTPDANTIYFVV